MPGSYFRPLKREFLNLSGGTVTGGTVFTNSLTASTIFSGSSSLQDVIRNISTEISLSGEFLSLSGGTGGEYSFTGSTSAQTIFVDTKIEPQTDNSVEIGSPIKRFRSLNTVNGIAINFTASTKIQLGNRELTETNIIITGDTIYGGEW